jgi:uncharacterized SAM-binding protein YcdF (DUF218 family)
VPISGGIIKNAKRAKKRAVIQLFIGIGLFICSCAFTVGSTQDNTIRESKGEALEVQKVLLSEKPIQKK